MTDLRLLAELDNSLDDVNEPNPLHTHTQTHPVRSVPGMHTHASYTAYT